MAELLSHLLIIWGVLTIASWGLDRLTPRWIAVGVIGGIFPDLNRLGLLVAESSVEGVFGIPFSWGGIHTLGGVLCLAGAGAMLFDREQAWAFVVLVAGGVIHLLTDAVKTYADGLGAMWLFPFSWVRLPTPNLYVSADPSVLVVSAVFVGVVFVIDWLVVGRDEE